MGPTSTMEPSCPRTERRLTCGVCGDPLGRSQTVEQPGRVYRGQRVAPRFGPCSSARETPRGGVNTCPACTKAFARPHYLRCHVRARRPPAIPDRAHHCEGANSFICDSCGGSFRLWENFQRHRKLHQQRET
eukprot:g22446.t1